MNTHTRLVILKQLAAGQTLDFVAAATGTDRSAVLALANHHGYPDLEKVAWARDKVAEQIDRAEKNPQPQPRPRPPAAARRTAIPAPPTRPTPQQPAQPAELAALLQAGRRSDKARTRNLAEKISTQVEDLRGRLKAEREQAEAAAKAAAEREQAEKRVADLERQLAEARANLPAAPRRPHTRSASKPGDYACRAELAAGEECGRTFDTPQGRAMHERRSHGYHHAQETDQ